MMNVKVLNQLADRAATKGVGPLQGPPRPAEMMAELVQAEWANLIQVDRLAEDERAAWRAVDARIEADRLAEEAAQTSEAFAQIDLECSQSPAVMP